MWSIYGALGTVRDVQHLGHVLKNREVWHCTCCMLMFPSYCSHAELVAVLYVADAGMHLQHGSQLP